MSERDSLFGSDFEPSSRYRIHVCLGPNCSPRGSRQLLQYLEEQIRSGGLEDEIEVMGTTCRNRCDFGPSVNVYPGPTFYNFVDRAGIDEIIELHLKHDEVVDRLLFTRIVSSK